MKKDHLEAAFAALRYVLRELEDAAEAARMHGCGEGETFLMEAADKLVAILNRENQKHGGPV
jgi:hypothetical protein